MPHWKFLSSIRISTTQAATKRNGSLSRVANPLQSCFSQADSQSEFWLSPSLQDRYLAATRPSGGVLWAAFWVASRFLQRSEHQKPEISGFACTNTQVRCCAGKKASAFRDITGMFGETLFYLCGRSSSSGRSPGRSEFLLKRAANQDGRKRGRYPSRAYTLHMLVPKTATESGLAHLVTVQQSKF